MKKFLIICLVIIGIIIVFKIPIIKIDNTQSVECTMLRSLPYIPSQEEIEDGYYKPCEGNGKATIFVYLFNKVNF
jgi:hypothetical protein